MKKARPSRSKSPSRRACFNGRRSMTGTAEGQGAMSLTAFVQRVRRALRHRPDDYRELVAIVTDLRRSCAGQTDDETITEHVISQVERAVSLLDCRPQLIAALRMFLPPQYSIDVQTDAVIVKVNESQGFYRMTDIDHCIPVDNTDVSSLPSRSTLQSGSTCLPPSSGSKSRPRTASTRSRSCPPGKRQGSRPLSNASTSHVERDRRRPATLPNPDTTGTVGYVMDVKRALASQPDVYRRFAGILHRFHDRRRAEASVELGSTDLDAIRQIVSLLCARPQLVLRFNDFLPDGYRIRMFDQSGYVIEYPDAVHGVARLTVAV